MKTVKEIESKLQEYANITKEIGDNHSNIKSIEFTPFENIPLSVFLKFSEKHKLKGEFETWSKRLKINLYSFLNPFGKFQTSIHTVEVERTVPIPEPVNSFREIKKPKK